MPPVRLRLLPFRWLASIDVKWWIASIIVPLLVGLITVEPFRNGMRSLFGVNPEAKPLPSYERATEKDRETTDRLKKIAEKLSLEDP